MGRQLTITDLVTHLVNLDEWFKRMYRWH
jgi:hypothetical protein